MTGDDADSARPEPTPVAGGGAARPQRDWRDRGKRGKRGTTHEQTWGLRLLLAVATAAAIVGLAFIAIAPLFSWQTACIAIVLDRHPGSILAPVPFADEDVAGLTEAIAGRASNATGRNLVRLTDLETSSALRERLFARMGDLRVRTKDVLLAYVRGQSLVVPPALDDAGNERDDPLNGVACLIAADLALRGERPAGLVPCRQLMEALGTGANQTTLVALDLGDLRWDPRLGVLCGLVPARLEEEFGSAHSRAAGDNWILTSHDALEYSGTSPGDRRSLFALALQRGLEGEADAAGWGDADGIIELDELARFVTVTTIEWSRSVSGGRHIQQPVIWKLGVGRVPLADLPTDVPIIRAPRRSGVRDVPLLRRFFGGGAAAAKKDEPSPAAPAAGPDSPSRAAPSSPPADAAAANGSAAPVAESQPAAPPGDRPSPDAPEPSGSSVSPSDAASAAPPAAVAPPVAAEPPAAAAPSATEPASTAAAAPATEAAGTGAAGTPAAQPGASAAAPAAAETIATPPATGQPDATKAVPAPTAPQPTAAPASQAPAPRRPAPPTDPWLVLERQTRRTESEPASLIDFAPHVWRRAVTRIARADVGARIDAAAEPGSSALIRDFVRAMESADQNPDGVSNTADLILKARRAAESKGVLENWKTAFPAERALAAARNDAFELTLALLMTGGRVSGGAGPVTFSPLAIQTAIDQVAAASDLVSRTGQEAQDVDPDDQLATATQFLRVRTLTLRDVADETLATMFGSSTAGEPAVFHELRIVLDSPVPRSSERPRLTRQLAAVLESPRLGPVRPPTRQLVPSRRPRSRIDDIARRNIAALAGSLVDLYAASGVTEAAAVGRQRLLGPLEEDLARARDAVADLLTERDADAAGGSILGLAARLTRLLANAAVTADSASASNPEDADATRADRLAGVLRILDPRDAASIGESLLARLPHARDRGPGSLTLTVAGDAPTAVGTPVRLSARLDPSPVDPTRAEAIFTYDPALLTLLTFDGTPIESGVPLASPALAWRGNTAEVVATPLTSVELRAATAEATVRLTLRGDTRSETARVVVPLPRNRDLILVARGARPTLIGPVDADGWSHARRGMAADDVPSLGLAPWPSGPTSWEFGIENLSGSPRTVDIEIHSVSSSPTPGDRDAQWRAALPQLRAGTPTTAPLLVAAKVSLPGDNQTVPLKLVPPAAAATAAKDAANKGNDAAASGPDAQQTLELPAPTAAAAPPAVGPDLAVLVRERDAKEGASVFVSRVQFAAIHPRNLVTAEARYDDQRRQIAVAFTPLASFDAASLPPGGISGRLRPLPRDAVVPLRAATGPSVGVPQVVARKPDVRLTAAGMSDVAVASWNGPDRGTAHLSLDVNGYPRAFTFAVDCSPAAAGRPQGPQRDWRGIRIEQPAAERSLIRAPAATIPMAIAADAPADTFLASGDTSGAVAVVLRQIGAGLAGTDTERVAWSADSDRKVTYTLQPSDAGGVTVTTAVEDWSFEASGEGLANVDVVAEARLVAAAGSGAVTDSRTFVFDGTPPVVDAPPAMAGVVGRPLMIPIRVSDDVSDGFFVPPERIRPGVSGLERVEWAIDLAGTGEPKEWQPAVRREGVRYEVRIDTAKLPQGIRLPLLVRATDRVGLSAPPKRVWIDMAAEPASTKNDLLGRVTLDGRGEAGVSVTISGPSGERSVRSGSKGEFRFTALEPGEYRVVAAGPVRNTSRRAEPATVTVPPAPAPPPSVALELK